MGKWKLNSFGLIQVPANSRTCWSAPGCQALCCSPGLCAVTPHSSHDIYCQVKAFASFLTIQARTKPHTSVSWGATARSLLRTDYQVHEHESCRQVQGSRAGASVPRRTARTGHVRGEREGGSANTLQPVFAGSKRHMPRGRKWHEVNEQRSIKQRRDCCSQSSISSRLLQVAARVKRCAHVTESKLEDWSKVEEGNNLV